MAITKFPFKHFLAGCATDVKETQIGDSDLNFLMVANGINQSYSLGKILKDLGYTAIGSNTVLTLDSYSEANAEDYVFERSGSSTAYIAQSFTNTNSCTLDSVKFYLKKGGSPTGNIMAKIYAHTGTYGTTGKPTGYPLATSDNFNIATLTTSPQLITFTFSGAERIALSASTYYCVEIDYTGGDSSNRLEIARRFTSPTHSGNGAYSSDGSSWTPASYDFIFYVYGVTSDIPNKSVLGLFHFRQSSAIDKILATVDDVSSDDTQLFYSTGTSWTEIPAAETAWANKANMNVEMESFIGYCFFVGYGTTDGFLPVGTLTGTTFSTSAQCTSMPQAKYIKRYKDRLYIANSYYSAAAYPYRVYFSSVPSAGNITWTPASNFFDVDFAEEITGLAENFGYLIIFTQYSTYFYNGTSLKKIFEIGCSNNRSIQNIGKYCVWADQDNVWTSYQGSEPEAIGQSIAQLIQNSTSSNWCSTVIDKEYYIYLGNTKANGINYYDCIAIYNTQTKLWRWRTHGFDVAGNTIKSMARYFTSGQDYCIIGNNDGDIFKKSKYIDTTIYNSDAGTSIKSEFRTKALDFGDSDIEKKLVKVTVKTRYGQGMTVRARAWDKNNEADMPFTDIGVITEGHNTFDGAIVEGIKGKFIQFEFIEFSGKQAFEFLEFSAYVDGLIFEE